MAKQNKTKWDALSMKDRASFIRIGIKNGITDLEEIKSKYNELEFNKFDRGGEKSNLKSLIQGAKSYIMDVAQNNQTDFMSDYYDRNYIGTQELSKHIDQAREGIYDDLYQSTFLFSKNEQKKAFEDHGYILDNSGDYGLVKKAVGKRNLPIYKKNKDVISRNELEVLFNPESAWWLGSYETELDHSGNYPSAVYRDKDGNLYQNAWDLNDYGVASAGSEGAKYKGFRQLAANALDIVGNPFVVTTGIQPVNYERLLNYAMHKQDPNLVELAYSKLEDSVRESWNEGALSDMYSNFMTSTRIDNFISKEIRDKVTKDMDFKHYMKAIPFEKFIKNIDKYYSKKEQMEFGYYPKHNKKSLGGDLEIPLKNVQAFQYTLPNKQLNHWNDLSTHPSYIWTIDDATNVIKQFEGYRNKAYQLKDGNGNAQWLGGYGHALTPEEIKLYSSGTVIPDSTINAWLNKDIESKRKNIKTFYGDNIPEHAEALLLSLAYQGGDKLIRGARESDNTDGKGWSPNFEKTMIRYIKNPSKTNTDAVIDQMQYRDDVLGQGKDGLTSRYGLYRAMLDGTADPKRIKEYYDKHTFRHYRSNKAK